VRFELTGGFPPTVFKTAALNHSATLPLFGLSGRIQTYDTCSQSTGVITTLQKDGAGYLNRTDDLLVTRELLYQLS
jgi:hypothetical protein